ARAAAHVAGARIAVVRAGRAARLEEVGRAGGAGAGAALRQVALARRRAAHGARVPGGMRARRARAAAHVGGAHVAVVGTRRPARLEGVGRAGGAGAGAGLGRITGARRRPAHRAGVPRGMRAGRARAVADVSRADVAIVGARGPVRLEGVGRAGGAGAGAGLGDVALARRRPARRARVPRRVRAGGGADGAVAHVGGAGVAVVRAGRARRLDGVGRTRRAGAGTAVGHVALVRRRAADRRARLEAARGRAARARRPVRRPLIAVLARVDAAVAAVRIRLVGGDVRRPVLARDGGR